MAESKGKGKIKVVEVGGSYYEMGFQYGAACPEIHKMLEMTYQAFGGRDAVRALARKCIPMYLPATEKYAPDIVDEMKGMAAGAKMDFENIFLLNITYEIVVPPVMGCTSFAAAGEATANGEVIAGQNFDYIKTWGEFIVLLKMKPDRGPGMLAVAPAGCLGLLGFNTAGISLNLNMIRNKDWLKPGGGVPSHVMLAKVLSSENISAAVGAIAAAGGRAAKNYLLTSAQGDIADVEVTANDLDISYPERGILTHTNHFKAERFRSADLAPAFLPDSYIRAPRLFRLMENHLGSLSVRLMQELLSDHNNYPSSICRHLDPHNPLPMVDIKTVFSIISCPQEQKAYIALGNPCGNEYLEYQL